MKMDGSQSLNRNEKIVSDRRSTNKKKKLQLIRANEGKLMVFNTGYCYTSYIKYLLYTGAVYTRQGKAAIRIKSCSVISKINLFAIDMLILFPAFLILGNWKRPSVM